MGVRGPLPKSAAERAYEGGAAHRPMPGARPLLAGVLIERPKRMTAAARKIWDAYVEQLSMLGFLRPVDAGALGRLCEDVAYLQELQSGMRQHADEPERARKRRLREIREELQRLAEQGGLLDKLEELRDEERRLIATPLLGAAAFAMTPEGRRFTATINPLASRIMRAEMQFGLTPVSSQRLEGTLGSGFMAPIAPGAAAPDSGIEDLLQ